jgi:hypothetical protein
MLSDPKTLLALFGQPSAEGLRYIPPLGRYVFLAAMIFLVFDVAQDRGWIQNRKPMSWMKMPHPRFLSIAAFVSVLALCLLVLLISWTNGGVQDYSAIGGLIPHSDARGYFEGAERLLHDGVLTQWTERRPLNAAFLAARLFLSQDNFYHAMAMQAIVAATALFLASSAMRKFQGTSIALVFFAINFSFLSACLYLTLSESLGISFGLIAFALYWPSIAHRNLTHYACATFFLALALLTRAGAMFELLASILFAIFFFADNWKRRCAALAATFAAIAGAWLLNAAIVRTYGTGGALLSNFSYTLYGLSQGGKNWSQVAIDFPQLSGDDSYVASVLYRRAFETILSNPLLLVIGLAKSFLLSAIYFPLHFFRLLADASDGGSPWKKIHVVVTAGLLVPPTVYGLFRSASRKRATLDRFHLFMIFQMTGFVASLPFFYYDGGIRLTAATFPFLAAAVAMILAACKSAQASKKSVEVLPIQNYIGISLGLAVVAVSLTVPMYSRTPAPLPATAAIPCAENNEQLRLALGEGTAHINILDGNVSSVLPDMRRTDFRVSDSDENKEFWQQFPLPTTLIMGFDYISRSVRLVSGPAGFADGPRRIGTICAMSLGNGVFAYRNPL